jgi:hypothetical protein
MALAMAAGGFWVLAIATVVCLMAVATHVWAMAVATAAGGF